MTLRVRTLSPAGDMLFGSSGAAFLADSPEAVAQIVGTTLKLWLGEWFLDLSAGVPWQTQVAGKGTMPLAVMVVRSAILNVPGVVTLSNLSLHLDRDTRTFTVQITGLQTAFGSAGDLSLPLSLS